jgi:hypothetical protein
MLYTFIGEACFILEDLYDVQEVSVHKCPACIPPIRLNKTNGQHVLAHITSHVLHNPTINKSQEPCGLCLQAANICTIYLTKCPRQSY